MPFNEVERHAHCIDFGGKPMRRISIICLAAFMVLLSAQAPAADKTPGGVTVRTANGILKVEVVADNIIRVAFAKDPVFFQRSSLAAEPRPHGRTDWSVKEGPGQMVLSTRALRVSIDKKSGHVEFFDASGQPILFERKGGRTLTPAEVQGEKTFHVRQEWDSPINESLYGLGQHHLGLMDIKGYDIDLWQHNGTVIVPFLVSSRGYGILWDNTSFSRFGDTREFEPIPAERLYGKSGQAGGLTGSYFSGAQFDKFIAERVDSKIDIAISGETRQPNRLIHPDLPGGNACVRWEGSVEPAASGDHLFQAFSNSGIRFWVDDSLVMDHWRQGWLPWLDMAKVYLTAGRRHRLRLEWSKDQYMDTMRLLWKTPTVHPSTSLWSEVGEGVDYYFVYGPGLDGVVAGYRTITGRAPMMPRWAFGLWQSRQRYKTAQESLDILEAFRSKKIPVDILVQDWFYWKEDQWGSHQFDAKRFPDPDAWIKAVHDRYKARLLISVWPKFYPGTANFDAMRSRGFLYESNLKEGIKDWVGYPDTFYDAFNSDARKLYWEQIRRELFCRKIDSWWLDATEPDLLPTPTLDGQRTHVHPTALGTGSRMLNAYSLYHSKGVYEGQRSAAPDQRVCILTRSGFSGQQRYAAAVWSGDITSTWTAMKKQITAGLGFCLSGLPYWSMDIGGFAVPPRFSSQKPDSADAEEWREMNTRWFQFGAFVPLFRAHGEYPNREPWEFGGESHAAFKTILDFDRLRYRLLPYVYSLAGDVTHNDGTIMRPLVMDFQNDMTARSVTDQYLFGPAFLVCPVTEYKARSRSVYLPKDAGWVDFWTGARFDGGKTIQADAPYEKLPLFVRAGSIVPFGPELQYTDEKPADPVILRVYGGADGRFVLYEDDGLTYGYEKGVYARIPIAWDDANHRLTIGKRKGSYPGMLKERTFQAVLISEGKPAGFSFEPAAGKQIRYNGKEVAVQF
jgi:alpha-D-xyloside xylohydrolase